MLEQCLSKKNSKLKCIIWPEKSNDVPDTKELKLIILKNFSQKKCQEILEYYGERPKVHKNTLFFLSLSQEGQFNFNQFLRKKLAWERIEKDSNLNLTEKQKEEVRNNIEETRKNSKRQIRNFYRSLLLPSKDKFEKKDLGLAYANYQKNLDEEVYEELKKQEEIHEKLNPNVIQVKYLKDNYVPTKNLLDSFYTTPGEIRPSTEDVLKDAIKEGVKKVYLGLVP